MKSAMGLALVLSMSSACVSNEPAEEPEGETDAPLDVETEPASDVTYARLAFLNCLRVADTMPEDEESLYKACAATYIRRTNGLGAAASALEIHDGQALNRCLSDCDVILGACANGCRVLDKDARPMCHQRCSEGHATCTNNCGRCPKGPRLWESD
jgi:hypothetical protein